MTHARIPDFSRPVPVRRHPGARAVALAAPLVLPRSSHLDLTNRRLPGEGDLWHVTAPVRPDTVHVRAPRFADLIGEGLAFALVLIVGGYLVGVATLL